MNTPKTTKISIVENSKAWMRTLVEALQETEGMQVIDIHSCGEDAFKKIIKTLPDIVIMEIDLPQMNGIECMMRILRKAPSISFLMFSTYEHNKYIFASLKGGASGYILKKEGAEGLIKGIEEWKAGGSPMSRSVACKVLRSFRPNTQLIQRISMRERQILNLLAKGLLYKEIAGELNPQISEGTVKQHIHRIYKKLQVNNRTEAINKYLKYV